MEIPKEILNIVVKLMKDCDGEDMHYVIEQVYMEEQMQKQLTCDADAHVMLGLVETWAYNMRSNFDGLSHEATLKKKLKLNKYITLMATALLNEARFLMED